MPESDTDYNKKKDTMIKVCETLINQKLTFGGIGIGRPINIKLGEFFNNSITPTTVETYKKEIEALKEELSELSKEPSTIANVPLIKINNQSIFKKFLNKVKQNKEINITYQRTEIENYADRLKKGYIRRIEGENYNRLIFMYQNEKGFFSYRGKIMKVRKNEKTKSIRLNICLLLFKWPAAHLISIDTLNSQTAEEVDIFSEYPNYQVGDKVHAGSLVDIILIREDEENRIMLPAHDNFRQIHDAVRGINSNAKIRLGIEKIFNYADQDVSVDENVLPLIVL